MSPKEVGGGWGGGGCGVLLYPANYMISELNSVCEQNAVCTGT